MPGATRVCMKAASRGASSPGRVVDYPKGWEGELPADLARVICGETEGKMVAGAEENKKFDGPSQTKRRKRV